jgi:putative transcriptional regulator
MSKAGDRLIRAALELQSIARGETAPAKVHLPPEVDVRAIRTRLKLSQAEFAAQFAFSPSQVRDWEQGRFRPTGSARAYLLVIERSPEHVRDALGRANCQPPGAEPKTRRRQSRSVSRAQAKAG